MANGEMPPELRAAVQRMIDAGESEDNIATVIRAHGQNAQGSLAKSATPFTPLAGSALGAFAKSPAVPAAIGALTRWGSVGAGIADAFKTGNPLQAAYGSAAAWPAGRAGYFLGKNLQAVAKPLATGFQKIAPMVNPLSAAQGINALAQIAEPQRKDIGFLGIGASQPSDPNHPALVNALVQKLLSGIRSPQ